MQACWINSTLERERGWCEVRDAYQALPSWHHHLRMSFPSSCLSEYSRSAHDPSHLATQSQFVPPCALACKDDVQCQQWKIAKTACSFGAIQHYIFESYTSEEDTHTRAFTNLKWDLFTGVRPHQEGPFCLSCQSAKCCWEPQHHQSGPHTIR